LLASEARSLLSGSRWKNRDAQPLPTGHYLMEEAPDRVLDYFVKFFTT
jgi:hypothetical protein